MITERELRLLRLVGVLRGRAMAPGRLHKAGNAESILKHCLRMLGLTRRYREGKLTRGQHRRLLMAIREYGRAWLRHEAEQFIQSFGGATRGIDDHRPVGRGEAEAAPDGGGLGEDPHASPTITAGGIVRGIRWESALGGYLDAVPTGLVPAARRFFARAKQFVRETIVAGVMSLLGPAPLTGEELEAIDKEAQKQEQFFDRFQADVLAPPPPAAPPITPGLVPETPIAPPKPAMTPKQFVARVEKYADSSWQAAQRINRATAIGQGVHKLERRVLGHPKKSHCEDCPPLAEQGWQPLGTLPQIGETECGPLCLCHFEFSDTGTAATLKGRVPLSGDVSTEVDDGGVYPMAYPPKK